MDVLPLVDVSFARSNIALDTRLPEILVVRFVGIVLLIISVYLVLRPLFRSHEMSQRVIL